MCRYTHIYIYIHMYTLVRICTSIHIIADAFLDVYRYALRCGSPTEDPLSQPSGGFSCQGLGENLGRRPELPFRNLSKATRRKDRVCKNQERRPPSHDIRTPCPVILDISIVVYYTIMRLFNRRVGGIILRM